ncbi:hypothetical protein COCOBI_14-4180 [Coccomyxa sp. Obi]|nr:hypothetical protein COCOBI_14-4180 [Coccomyxa sp. Obi]
METTDSPVLFESSAPFDKIEWHIHIGEEDFKALERCGWDNQIYYVDAVPQEGLLSRPPKCPSGCTSCTDALNSGHADCMRYWHGRSIASLADEDDDEPLRLSLQQLHPNCREAAQWPSAEVLMYAHDVLGLPWDAGTCAVAVGADSINCLSYAHCSGCSWDASVCSHAAMVGSLACLMYAHEHGCEWDWATCEAAAYYGHLDCLVYARTHGCEWDERTCSGAAFGGNIETLAYAFENGCDWDEATCCAAAYAGSIDCLVYAHERGCPWNGLTCERAAAHGHLQCLRYAHEQGCCWDQRTLYAAARAGDIDCLMYAHEHGCPYDNAAALLHCKHGLTFEAVHGKMSLPCVKYVCENMGCSWNPWGTEWERALLEGRCDVLEYIHLHGGAWCGQEKLLGMEEELRLWDLGGSFEGRARCLLYMHCCGGCKLPPLRGIKVGERVLALMQEKRAAVLLSFQAAGRARAGGRAADAVHAAMAMVPTDLIKQIICTAKLLITN